LLRFCLSAHWLCMLFTSHCTKNARLWLPTTGGSGLLQEVIQERSLLTISTLWRAAMHRVEQGGTRNA
jgi:hypothetical protein